MLVDAGDRDDVARDGDGALLIERHVDGVRGGDLKQRVAVGGSARDRLQREIAAGARPVVDHHRLAEPLRHRLTDQPRDDVGRAAGGNEHHQGHRPRRIGLRPRDPRHGRQRGSTRCQMQKSAARKFHGGRPIAEKATLVPLPIASKRLAGRDHVRKGGDVGYWHLADIGAHPPDVRYWG